MLNKIIYAIPGLGVDERVFYDLCLTFEIQYLKWLIPKQQENLRDYAERMAVNIPNDRPSILLGMSFGGILAQEISAIRPASALILISSIKSTDEKPWQLSLMKHVPLYYLSQGSWRVKAAGWLAPSYGIHKKEEIELLKDMFRSFGDVYRMWAIRQLCHWEGEEPTIPLLHVHGDQDKILPLKTVKRAKVIRGGNHFMVKQRAGEISKIINTWLEENG